MQGTYRESVMDLDQEGKGVHIEFSWPERTINLGGLSLSHSVTVICLNAVLRILPVAFRGKDASRTICFGTL